MQSDVLDNGGEGGLGALAIGIGETGPDTLTLTLRPGMLAALRAVSAEHQASITAMIMKYLAGGLDRDLAWLRAVHLARASAPHTSPNTPYSDLPR